MKNLLFSIFLLFPTAACAQLPYVPSCISQDSISIEDFGLDKAIVTYYNSFENCSKEAQIILEAPNGIQVRVILDIGGQEVGYKEIIQIIPLDSNLESYPAYEEVIDGETKEFIIMGGLS